MEGEEMTKKLTWKNLFDFLEGKKGCNFRETKSSSMTWDCNTTLKKTEAFCKKNNIDFETVETMCQNTGGYCDCEVIWNSMDKIKGNLKLPIKGGD